jgi:Asp-tRNA(Asn)/Glu-tRNA(Gln) amidotransferase A subunit family amidase
MSSPRLHTASYAAMTERFATGTSTPRAFLEECLERMARHEGDVLAFVATNIDHARRDADQATMRWRAGKPLSAIDGMPMGIKDVIETKDMPTQMGSPYFRAWQSNRDSATVAALREAGALILGKTVTTEFAATIAGPTRNPHDLTRTPGGSSSGSAAAVAAGFIASALGTQVVGSIVRPASYCGVWGFKPSVGGLNRGGSHDYMSQSCAGVLAASRADMWLTAIEIAARVGGDAGMVGLTGPTHCPTARKPQTIIALETPGWTRATDGAKQKLHKVLDELRRDGVKVITRKDSRAVDECEHLLAESLPLTRLINAWESMWPLNTYCAIRPDDISPYLRERLAEARTITRAHYQTALERRHFIRDHFARLKSEGACVITLSAPDVAPLGLEQTGDPIFVVHGSFLGVPALNVPGMMLNHLPLGIHLLGYAQEEASLVSYAGYIETCVSGLSHE